MGRVKHLRLILSRLFDRTPAANRLVRLGDDGLITLAPLFDFRDPRTVLPAARRPQPRPAIRRPLPAVPRFLYVERAGEC